MAENSGYLRHLFFSWGEMWTPLNYYVWYTTKHHVYVIFLMMSDFEIQKLAYCSCLLFTSS